MRTSDQINEIAAALAQAQANMSTVKKDKKANAGKYGYTYASFAAVVESVSGPLSASGIAFAQSISQADDGVTVSTRIMHSSGQWIEGDCRIPVANNGAQAVGSAITYGRRYGLCSLIGVVADDDDDAGQEANKNPPKKKTLEQAVQQKAKRPETVAELFASKLKACTDIATLDALAGSAPTNQMTDAETEAAKKVYRTRKIELTAQAVDGTIVDK